MNFLQLLVVMSFEEFMAETVCRKNTNVAIFSTPYNWNLNSMGVLLYASLCDVHEIHHSICHCQFRIDEQFIKSDNQQLQCITCIYIVYLYKYKVNSLLKWLAIVKIYRIDFFYDVSDFFGLSLRFDMS